jgi:hypothetical protein
MLQYLDTARRYLWALVELGFLAVLAIVLVYLLLGDNAGVFVTSVARNVTRFTSEVQTASLIGVGVILAIIYLVTQRMR